MVPVKSRVPVPVIFAVDVRSFVIEILPSFIIAALFVKSPVLIVPVFESVPLFIKDLVVRTFYTKVQDKNSSAGLTNMGALYVPESMKPYIERFDIYMGQPFSSRTNCAIISFEDILTINFASSIVEADVERYFFRKLVQDGIHVKIESNRDFI